MGNFCLPTFMSDGASVRKRLSSALKLKTVFFETAAYTRGMAHKHNASHIIYMGSQLLVNRQIMNMLIIYNTTRNRAYGLYLYISVFSSVSLITYSMGYEKIRALHTQWRPHALLQHTW